MFEEAAKIARQWTFPIIVSKRLADKRTVMSQLGTGFLINKDGYFLTAGHVIDIQKYAPEHIAFWTDRYGEDIETSIVDLNTDLGLGKLGDFQAPVGLSYPIFARHDIKELPVGKSLCVLGYPLNDFTSEWSKEEDCFLISPRKYAQPLPHVVDGILARGIISKYTEDDQLIETGYFIDLTAPGLQGQSGGPVIDTSGTVYGVLVQREVTYDEAYFNSARAVYWNTVCEFLDKNMIYYEYI